MLGAATIAYTTRKVFRYRPGEALLLASFKLVSNDPSHTTDLSRGESAGEDSRLSRTRLNARVQLDAADAFAAGSFATVNFIRESSSRLIRVADTSSGASVPSMLREHSKLVSTARTHACLTSTGRFYFPLLELLPARLARRKLT